MRYHYITLFFTPLEILDFIDWLVMKTVPLEDNTAGNTSQSEVTTKDKYLLSKYFGSFLGPSAMVHLFI